LPENAQATEKAKVAEEAVQLRVDSLFDLKEKSNADRNGLFDKLMFAERMQQLTKEFENEQARKDSQFEQKERAFSLLAALCPPIQTRLPLFVP
jgi:hypothetical protein